MMFKYFTMCFAFSITIIALINHNYIDKKRTKVENIVQQVPSQNKVEPQINVKPQPPVIEKEPGDNVQWMNFPKQKSVNNSNYGPVLTDIVEHLPSKYGSKYSSSDPNTEGHESTHGISSELRNYYAKNGANGFYCLNNKSAFILNPKITIAQVAQRVPLELRLGRYQLYLIQQQKDWNDTPTYLLDEFNAYVNGAEVSVDQYKIRKPSNHTDDLISPIEFSYYALAMCQAVEELDPNYSDMKQLKEFVAYNIKRTARLYKEGIVLPELTWDTELITKFNTSKLKREAIKWYGEDFCNKYLDLKH